MLVQDKGKTHLYVFSLFFLQLHMYCTFCTKWKSVKIIYVVLTLTDTM